MTSKGSFLETTHYLGIVLDNWLHSLVSQDVLFYVLFLFLPALFLVVIYKHKPWKKLWQGIAFALPIIVCVSPFAFFMWVFWKTLSNDDAYDFIRISVVLLIYVIGGIVGYYFNVRRGRHWLLLLAGLFSACSVYAFLDSYPPKLSSFGSIVDEPISEKQENFDYEIRMEFANANITIDSTIYDKRVVQLRVKGDSAFVCTSKEMCGIKDSTEICEWIALKTNDDATSIKDVNDQFSIKVDTIYYSPLGGADNLRQFYECCAEILKPFALEIPFDVSPEKRTVSQIHLLKKLVESYKEEKVPYNMWDGYMFDITLLDYRRGAKRSIEIGNAMAAEPRDLSNAKRIDEIARSFLPITKNTPMDWRGEQCKN